jgi:hypothetical protein
MEEGGRVFYYGMGMEGREMARMQVGDILIEKGGMFIVSLMCDAE